jgi:hypothetical protein
MTQGDVLILVRIVARQSSTIFASRRSCDHTLFSSLAEACSTSAATGCLNMYGWCRVPQKSVICPFQIWKSYHQDALRHAPR